MSITGINQAAVIMDTNVLLCDKDDSTLFQIIDEVQFFEYPHCGGVGYSNFSLLPMDTVLVKAQFHVKQGTELNPIILKSLTASIVAVRQNDVEEIPLEAFSINTADFLPNCENIQEIEFEQARDFILPTDDCRNEIRLFRMPTLDIAGFSAYEFQYPFKVRWEEWRKFQPPPGRLSQAISGQPSKRCFPTPTENWRIFANEAGWSIKFAINAEVDELFPVTDELVENPIKTEFEHLTWGSIKDPCDIPYSVEFETFDVALVESYERVVPMDIDVGIVATITGDFSSHSAEQLYGILSLDAWGVGGINYVQEIGTRIATDANSVWYGASNTLFATLVRVDANTVTITAFLNKDFLPTDTNQFILSARVGDFRIVESSVGPCISDTLIEDFTCGELQIVKVNSANEIVVTGEVETEELRDVLVEDMVLTFLTPVTWRVTGGLIDGRIIKFGTVGGTVVRAPVHPYTDAIVGDTIQGQLSGVTGSVLFEDEECPSDCFLLLETGAPVLSEDGINYILLEECE